MDLDMYTSRRKSATGFGVDCSRFVGSRCPIVDGAGSFVGLLVVTTSSVDGKLEDEIRERSVLGETEPGEEEIPRDHLR